MHDATYRRPAPPGTRPQLQHPLDQGINLPGVVGENHAREAYDRMAPVYDAFNQGNDYEHWLGDVLLPELGKHGLRLPSRPLDASVLDVGCGTGRAFAPLLNRGWKVAGCDVSDAMLVAASEKFPFVPLLCADATDLPTYSHDFDLILALNDVVNYLTEDGDLEQFFEGVKRNLAPHGLVCFDANCLSLFESNWIADREPEINERGWRWRGLTPAVEPGGIYEVEVSGEGFETHRHRERHWPRPKIEAAMEVVGLKALAALGQQEGGESLVLEEPPDEHRDQKTIYIGGLNA